VLTRGAILGRAGPNLALHLAQSWGGLNTRMLSLDGILSRQIPTSPKLPTVLQTWARPSAITTPAGGATRAIGLQFRGSGSILDGSSQRR